MRPAVLSGIFTEHAPVSYWPIFSPPLVTVPEVFAKVNSTQFFLASKVAEFAVYKVLGTLRNPDDDGNGNVKKQ